MKTLLVAMSRPDTVYGTHPAHYAVLSGRQVLQHGQGVADELRALPGQALRLSLDSAANLTERLRVRALSRRFVPVLVQRQLAENGAFSDRFRFRSQVRSLRQGEAEVDVTAMMEDDAELAQELLPSQQRPLTHLVTAEASVAALVGAVANGPVLVHWWHDGGLRTLGVRSGRVVWQRVEPFAGKRSGADPEPWKPMLDAASASAPHEFASAHGHTVRLGQGPWAAGGEWASNGSRELVNQLGALFKGVDAAEVLGHPDLYGLVFVQRRQSLIVNGYRQRVLAWQLAPALAAATGLVGAALLGLGLWWHQQAAQQLAQLQLQTTTLAAQARLLQQQSPPAEAVTALRSAVWRESAMGANLRADHFLNALLNELPEGAKVVKLSIQRNTVAEARVQTQNGQPVNLARRGKRTDEAVQLAQKAPAPTKAIAPAVADKAEPASLEPASEVVTFKPAVPVRRMPGAKEPSFQVDLDIALGGGYSGAKLKAEALAEKLSRLGRLANTRLTFQDTGVQAPGAKLKTQLTIAAGAF